MNIKKPLEGCTFGILGDSYSTFRGWVPEGNDVYYPNPDRVDDVLDVKDTWWHLLMERHHLQLLINDSYSGATVCTNTRDGQPPISAFTERAKRSFSGEVQPDYIIVFGGTNDSWLERTVGQVKFSDRTEEDLKQTLPAFCEVLEHILRHNPNSTVVSVVNTRLHSGIRKGIVEASDHYGVLSVVLSDIDKQNGHPSALGMRQIADQIEAALNR